MSTVIEYLSNMASEKEIADHLSLCDGDFMPPLSDRVKIDDYAKKITNKAMRFEAWSGSKLVGLVAAYCNDQEKLVTYITSVSVLREWTGKAIAHNLMKQCIEHVKTLDVRQIVLEVATENTSAVKLYEESGFVMGRLNAPFVRMDLNLKQ